jgi:hypothetical protein
MKVKAKLFDYNEINHKKFISASVPEYFIIRRQPPGAGLFSNLNHVMQGIERAKQLRLNPIVDMQYYWTEYSVPGKFIDTRNAWEYFFIQLTDTKLKDVYRQKRYVISKGNRILENHWLSSNSLNFVYEHKLLIYAHNLYHEHIRLNPFTKNVLDKIKEDIAWSPSTSLGITYRGSDYVKLRPLGHPVQPTISDLINIFDLEMKYKKCYNILVASEEMKLRKLIMDKFPYNVYKNFRTYEYMSKFIPKKGFISRASDPKLLQTLGYLIEVYLLSECNTFIGSLANGSCAALIINGANYETKHLFNLGTY